MILVIDNETRFIKKICSFLKKNGFSYKIKNFSRIRLEDMKGFDAIILSGGHHHPNVIEKKRDFDKEIRLIKQVKLPIFAICLGFEVVCYTFGCKLNDMHHYEKGICKINIIKKGGIFKDCPKKLKIFEDHRWDIIKISKALEVLATSSDGIEAVRHKRKPIYGVQFHPEIRKGNQGYKAFENFLQLIKERYK